VAKGVTIDAVITPGVTKITYIQRKAISILKKLFRLKIKKK
jgi:hypothetical protein